MQSIKSYAEDFDHDAAQAEARAHDLLSEATVERRKAEEYRATAQSLRTLAALPAGKEGQ